MTRKVKIPHQLLPNERAMGKMFVPTVQQRRQCEVIKLFGTIDFDPNFDYKVERMRR